MNINLPDALQNVVNLVSTELGYTVFFRYGTYEELVENLRVLNYNDDVTSLDENRNYPLIWLPLDIEEQHGNDYSYLATIKLILATQTLPDYTTEERFTNSFKAVLQPIYECLLDKLVTCGYFEQSSPELIEHNKYDRVHWGKTQLIDTNGNGLDFVDAIEITELKLNVKLNNCKRQWPI